MDDSVELRGEDSLHTPQFESKTYVVTDTCCQVVCCLACPLTFLPLVPGVMGTKVMTLEPEEAVLQTDCCGCHNLSRRPYGELGSVDSSQCCCCVGVASNLSKGAPIMPGSGCNQALVNEIVEELKARMKHRGDTGQIQRAEALQIQLRAIQADMRHLQACVDMMLEERGLRPPARPAMV